MDNRLQSLFSHTSKFFTILIIFATLNEVTANVGELNNPHDYILPTSNSKLHISKNGAVSSDGAVCSEIGA